MFRTNKSIISDIGDVVCITPVPIEQFPASDFFDNAAGWHRNDIAAIASAASMEEYKAMVENLVMNDPTFNIKDGEKIEASIKKIVPRWCQSPLEIQNFAQSVAQSQLDDAYTEALKDVELNKDKEIKESSPTPSPEASAEK